MGEHPGSHSFRSLLLIGVLAFLAAPTAKVAPTATWGKGSRSLAIATGSPGELGLLEHLAREFAAENDAQVHWYRAGSGEALTLLKQGKVDMVLAHAPEAEQQAVIQGWATGRALIGSNEFWIVGPAEDPAHVADAADAADALRRIHAARSPFVSRGDESGTHQREMALWRSAEITPEGDWYIVTGAPMTESLRRADAEGAYFLTDSSTFIAQRSSLASLRLLYRGDEALSNPCHTLYPTNATPGTALAMRFREFILSKRGQALLCRFGRARYGEPLYLDAAATEKRALRQRS